MNCLDKPCEIVLDTNAIKIIAEKELRDKLVKFVLEKCHTLIIPGLESEFQIHIKGNILQFLSAFRTELRRKFVYESTSLRIPREIEKRMRECASESKSTSVKGDLFVIGVALKRHVDSRRHVVIVTNDHCFHEVPEFKRYDICVIYVEDLVRRVEEL